MTRDKNLSDKPEVLLCQFQELNNSAFVVMSCLETAIEHGIRGRSVMGAKFGLNIRQNLRFTSIILLPVC